MNNIRIRAAAVLSSALALFASASAQAEDAWPAKPVTIVVSFAPGGATDLVGRLIAKDLGVAFKQPFVVENRPGAGGQVGTEYVAKRPADGYTLLVSATGHVIAPSVQAKVNYQPEKDFEPIALLMTMPNLLVVNPTLVPANNMKEFLQWARTQKDKGIPYASAGVGGATHLSGELFRTMSGLPLFHVTYKGANPAIMDAVAGQIPVVFQDSVSVNAYVTSDKLRALAVTRNERSKLYPDLPTIEESGFKGYDLYNWVGLYAPAGTPKDIVTKLNGEVTRILSAPDTVARLEKLGTDRPVNMNPAEFRAFVEAEVVKWRAAMKASGVVMLQ